MDLNFNRFKLKNEDLTMEFQTLSPRNNRKGVVLKEFAREVF